MTSDKHYMLLAESIRMFNALGERHNIGDDPRWITGMIRHHLPILMQRVKTSEDRDLVESKLSKPAVRVIDMYVKSIKYSGRDVSELTKNLARCGLISIQTD